MLKIFFALFMLLGFSTAHAYLGHEADRRQRDWMMNIVFAPPPKVETRPANYNKVFGYDIYNKSGQYISKINFRHATSTNVTSVDTLSKIPRLRQQYGLSLKIDGLRNGADNQWRLVQGYDTSFYMINIPVYGADSSCCTDTHGKVDMQVIWANGAVKNYRLPYPCGTVYVRADSIFVRLGSGTNLSLCEKVLYPTPQQLSTVPRIANNKTVATDSSGEYTDANGIVYSKNGRVLKNDKKREVQYLSIPSGVTTISPYAFVRRKDLYSVKLPHTLISIGDKAFFGCPLRHVFIPENVREIGEDAFTFSKNIEVHPNNNYFKVFSGLLIDLTNRSIIWSHPDLKGHYNIPNGIITVGVNAFRQSKIESVTIPATVAVVGNQAFRNCTNLHSVKIDGNLTGIGEYAFEGCKNLQKIVIPQSVTRIGDHAFQDCKALKEIEIPHGVTKIESGTFKNCNLEKVTIPASVTEIDFFAFDCKGLQEVRLPRNCRYNRKFTFPKNCRIIEY